MYRCEIVSCVRVSIQAEIFTLKREGGKKNPHGGTVFFVQAKKQFSAMVREKLD